MNTYCTQLTQSPIQEITSVSSFIKHNRMNLPLYASKVSAGFPSPADDYIEKHLDLNDLVKNPASTFFVKVAGHALKDAGIYENDILIVDRSLPALPGKVVISVIDGQLMIKRIDKHSGKLYLMPTNTEFAPIEIKEEDDLHIWGVVTKVIHDM
ncbi:MAG: translesion error-prone DNA polymerase V autoproteolytic subunit [Gammaproteobacteria bacterium]|nr:translesion error-prone DNA polymerase V autoproteolytic subunit [Gammaproteobacteria bacterium]